VSLVQIPTNQHAVITGIKSGRRNSAKDADELRAIADHAREIITAIDGLLAETTQPDMDEEDAKQAQTVTAAQPQTVPPRRPQPSHTSRK
jgi:hypothetical protein